MTSFPNSLKIQGHILCRQSPHCIREMAHGTEKPTDTMQGATKANDLCSHTHKEPPLKSALNSSKEY